MSRTNDQHFEVSIEMSVFNIGDKDVTSREVEKAIIKALDTLPLDLDYGDINISIDNTEDESDNFASDEFGPID